MNADKTQRALWELCYSQNLYPAFLACFASRVVDVLKAGPISISKLALRTGLSVDQVMALLPVLCFTGIARLKENRLYPQPLLRWMVKSKWLAMIDRHLVDNKAFTDLFKEFKQPGEVKARKFWRDIYHKREKALRFMLSMEAHTHLCVTELARRFGMTDYRRLVDIGAGIGTVGIGIASNLRLQECILIDLPACLKIARKAREQEISRAGVILRPIDMFAEQWPHLTGVYLLSHVLQDYSSSDRQRLLEMAAKNVAPGSELWVHGVFFDPVEADAVSSAFGFYLSAKLGGCIISCEQQAVECKAAGFKLKRSFHTAGVQKCLVFSK